MNKYEIAARLAAHDIYDGEIVKYIARTSSRLREDCDGCDDCNNAPLAVLKEIQEGKRYDANLARGEAEKYEAVLAEIEAAESPEPAPDDAPCAFPGCKVPRQHNYHCKEEIGVCLGGHTPMLGAHPYEPAQSAMRYASGEAPMVGDVVSIRESADPNAYCDSATVSEVSRSFVYFGEARDRAVISQCTLVRRADTPEEAKDEGVDREPVRSIHAAKCLLEAMRALNECLFWDRTREGHDYWRGIYDRLRELAATAEAAK